MRNRGETFTDRLETAAKAKEALLEKARKKNPANDPEFAARQEARAAASYAREERESERLIAKLAEQTKAAAERDALKAEQAALAAERAESIKQGKRPQSTPALSPAEQKAARDARYAARKARKK